MNMDQVKGKWKQIAGGVKAKWGDLTDDDITQIDGNAEVLAGKLQERYGWSKEEAKKNIDDHFAGLE